MDIRNFTQFANLLASTQTIHLNGSFDRIFTCMMLYNSFCSCGGNTDRDRASKHSECNRIYREALGSVDGIKAHLFKNSSDNTISFYIDDVHHIKTLCR